MEFITQNLAPISFTAIGFLTVGVLYLLLLNLPDNGQVLIAQWLYSVTNSPYSELEQRIECLQRHLPNAKIHIESTKKEGAVTTVVIKNKDTARTYSMYPTPNGTGYVAN